MGVLGIRSGRGIGLEMLSMLPYAASKISTSGRPSPDITQLCTNSAQEEYIAAFSKRPILKKTRGHGHGEPHGDLECSILSMRLYRKDYKWRDAIGYSRP